MKEENKKKTIILTIIAISSLLIVVFGATYAYFQIIATANATNLNAQGSTDTMPKGVLVTNITELKINLDAKLMSEGNKGTIYYATPSGTPVTTASEGSGKYVLATASLDKSGLSYDCGYSYTISATRTKAINDGSDADVKVRITGSDGYTETYTLAELLSGNQTYSGNIKGLTYGTNQNIYIEAYVENTSSKQDDLAGNSFSFKIELVSNSFSCDVAELALAEKLIASGELWQSALEGDGYRYVGSGTYNSSTTPDNFICFGTTDKTTCKNDEAKYMYRIIGVFEGSDGKQHLKLIKLAQLDSSYQWNSYYQSGALWGENDLYAGLNGEYFLTNTTYDYLQNSTWLNKIANWTWSAVKTNGGLNYSSITTREVYSHEMNRSTKSSTIGKWSTPSGRIGLIYVSDYLMSLGDGSLSYTSKNDSTLLKTGWLHYVNNGNSTLALSKNNDFITLLATGPVNAFYGEWTISIDGQKVWGIESSGGVNSDDSDVYMSVRPVFYLTSEVKSSKGSGEYNDPYILQ